jgi:hypothetical protein
MKPPKDLEEAGEVGVEVDSEEEEMGEEGQEYVTTVMNKVTWLEASLTQDLHGALSAELTSMQPKTTDN